jgi:hypothetical protein
MSKILTYLSEETGLSEHLVHKIAMSAPRRYKVYSIPKRTGGERIIAQPAREVKVLQRALISGPLSELKIHPAVMSYRAGLSILDNAKRHAGDGAILKMDFKNFFPSITGFDWRRYCRETRFLVDEADIELTTALFFRRLGKSERLQLAIGAPSSPMLSNALMFEFDSQIQEIVLQDKVSYTRYADDLTFSAPRAGHLRDVIKNVKRVLKDLKYPKVGINDDKTVVATAKYRRNVTGLILANDGRVTIGRYRKRILSAMIYRFKNGQLAQAQQQYLAGYLAFVATVEPEFLVKLENRYGGEVIGRIQRTIILGSKISAEVRDTMALK